MVGRRGKAPMVPPHILCNFKLDAAVRVVPVPLAARSRKRSSKFRQLDASPRNTSQRRRNRREAGEHQRMQKTPEKQGLS